MYAWETLTLYCAHNRRWFETSSRYLPDGTHLTVYRALMPAEWRLRRRGLWYIADPPDTPVALQGWKLHVTAPVDGTVEVLRRALPGLRDALVPFKFLLDPRTNAMTSRKTWPRGSSGKFLTVYPPSEERFLEIADWLAEALDGIAGPYILSDRRYRGSKAVYYRYGGFVGLPQLQPDGTAMLMIKAPDGSLVPDLRQPYWHAPEWAGNPVADDGVEGSDDDQLLGGRFAVTAALSFSNQGGVYVASDARTGRDVAIKEARPHVLCGSANAQAVDVLEKEHRLLQLLADTGRFVRPVAFFREWEHAFLAEERLDGQQLGQLSISLNPLCNLDLTGPAFHDYLTRMRDLWRQVAEAIAAAHERGVLLGDLSFTNVMVVDGDRTVKVIDLEAAVQEGIDPELGIHTIGFASPRTVETNRYDRANDYHALGALMLGSLMVVNSTVGYYRPALRRFLDALAADLALPPALVVLIADLTDVQARDWDPNEVLARIDALDFSAAEPPPLAFPATAPTPDLEARVRETVAGIAQYAVETADPHRDDRLFPADLGVFETNPLSVAFGALGVMRALHRLTGTAAPGFLAWALRHDGHSAAVPPGLYLGQAGIAWSFAELGEIEVARAILARAAEHPLLWESYDLFNGCAGYGLAQLRLWQLTGDRMHLEEARKVGGRLAQDAVHGERGAHWPVADGPDGEMSVPVGYAYGSAGIALFLLYLYSATRDETVLALGRAGLDFDLAQTVRVNERARGYPSHAADGAVESGVVRNYWDEGTAGVTTVAIRYLTVQPDDSLRRVVRENLEDSCRKYAVMPQLFHGLAGIGNVLLDAFELTGEQRYLHEAWRTAEGVLLFRVDRHEGIVFPGEQSLRESTDFATGSAGVGLFLDRLGHARPAGRTNFNFVLDDLLPPGTISLRDP